MSGTRACHRTADASGTPFFFLQYISHSQEDDRCQNNEGYDCYHIHIAVSFHL